MPHIVIDARNLRLSTGRYHRKLLEHLAAIDTTTQYTVLVSPDDVPAWEPATANFSRKVIPYRHYRLNEQLGYAWFLYRQKADLVHFLMPQQPLLFFGKNITNVLDLTLLYFENAKKSRFIFKFKQWVFSWFVKVICQRAARVITITDYARDDIIRYTGLPPQKIVRTYNAAERILDEPKAVKQLEGRRFLLFVGNAHVHKNLPRLVEAYEKLLTKHPDLHLVLAGKRTIHYDRLAELGAAKGLQNLHILGYITDAEQRWLYEHALVYVFPSLSEGFGLPGLEAMLYDLPVASSNASCLPEVYQDSVEYFDPLDTDNMAKVIERVMTDDTVRQRLITTGHAQTQKYSWRRMAQETLAVYKQALKG